jgi:hypothetical protein
MYGRNRRSKQELGESKKIGLIREFQGNMGQLVTLTTTAINQQTMR